MNTFASTLHYNQPFLTPAVLKVKLRPNNFNHLGSVYMVILESTSHPQLRSGTEALLLLCVPSQKLIQLSEPHSLLLDRILKLPI